MKKKVNPCKLPQKKKKKKAGQKKQTLRQKTISGIGRTTT